MSKEQRHFTEKAIHDHIMLMLHNMGKDLEADAKRVEYEALT